MRGVGAAPAVVAAALFATLAFQEHVFIDSAAFYLRLATPEQVPMLSPVFWIGFNLGLLPLSLAASAGRGARRWAPPRPRRRARRVRPRSRRPWRR